MPEPGKPPKTDETRNTKCNPVTDARAARRRTREFDRPGVNKTRPIPVCFYSVLLGPKVTHTAFAHTRAPAAGHKSEQFRPIKRGAPVSAVDPVAFARARN